MIVNIVHSCAPNNKLFLYRSKVWGGDGGGGLVKVWGHRPPEYSLHMQYAIYFIYIFIFFSKW